MSVLHLKLSGMKCWKDLCRFIVVKYPTYPTKRRSACEVVFHANHFSHIVQFISDSTYVILSHFYFISQQLIWKILQSVSPLQLYVWYYYKNVYLRRTDRLLSSAACFLPDTINCILYTQQLCPYDPCESQTLTFVGITVLYQTTQFTFMSPVTELPHVKT